MRAPSPVARWKQVDRDLLDLDPIHQHQVVFRIEIEAKLDPLLAGTGETERAGFFNQFRKTFDALLGFSPRHEIAKPPDDLAGADGLLGGAIEGAFNLCGMWGFETSSQELARTLHGC